MSLYLYGIIGQTEAIDFGPIGFKGGKVISLPAGEIAAVVGPPPAEIFAKLHKEILIAFLLAHQKTLEQVMKKNFVLPFKFGTILKNESEMIEILKEGRKPLIDLMESIKERTEIDVIATWEVTRMLQEISEEDPEVLVLKKEMAKGNADPVLIGMCLAKALKKRAEGWQKKIKEKLKGHSVACADHDLLNDTMILNSSFLIHHDKEREFNRALEATDSDFQNKLRFKCVGPLPPYSFATVTIKRFDPEEIRRSAKILGLNGKAELTFVKKVYKELSRQCHPDMDPNLSVQKFEELNRAYELIFDYCKDKPRFLSREAVEGSVRLESAIPQGGLSDAA
ncbi:MAG: hypothetical protein A3G32_03835 [Deltaproteobacteria bacterium RIFCSPLOWO2_12_FULL_40_28]|nr:MAG: hypothetical protein A3C45_05725 [Deltaproteobacteria bacterium RIFCSPHIGHO2_02_FULL_40_28]OGQ19451.1 MAG: hypothetical protein A3E27_06355 [Deltaproteobacteria bacterium RIFCSPHIGHO2_12_FULL_40_32]OGQ39895.1 MAG: hypothetical protein A3I69_07320 [Deltaproteobacteria bacterium RIFCSPLOWO2_02_FULL_40_36]OGQ53888.1 MAG: hypothetical protein A3G32_03835 [Deltaproteobacteria bacterium RIFCSPLOWO2_12_FULL_40_28]